MALQHAMSGQAIALERPGEDPAQFASIALVKTEQLELIRLVMPKGKRMPEHAVAGEISLLCLRGAIVVEAHGRNTVLHGGEMLYLAGGTSHALRAEEDALALLTILLKD